ncbi:putative mitochondrial protein, partial [Mucuna pruriens]
MGGNNPSQMVTGKGFTKRSTSEEKPFIKSSRGEYYTYCKRPGHTKDTCYKLYGKEKVLERMGGNKGPTQMWVKQTTSNKKNIVEHPSTLQLDQDIQAFSKEEMDRLRALLNSISKPLPLCDLTMKVESVIESLSFPTQDVIESLPFPTQDVQVQVQEVTKLTLVPEQVQLSEPKSFIIVINAIKISTLVQEALRDENWVQAMKEEIKALEKNSTWEIVDRPKDKRVVGCRWIYIMMGALERYKERLVAKWYTQTYAIDYEETFTPIAKMNVIILDDLKVKYEGLIKLFRDNNSTISIVHNPVQHNRIKHIEIDKHFIKEKLNSGLVVVAHALIGLQVVDVFTKGFATARFQELNGKLGMIDIHLPT